MTANSYIGPKEHVQALSCLLAGGLLLLCAPHAVLGAQYQCVLHRLTGLNCPFCGMTRDFILMSQGFPPRHNPGSLPVAAALYVAYPAWIAMAALRRPSWLWVGREKLVKAVMLAMVVLFICNNLIG